MDLGRSSSIEQEVLDQVGKSTEDNCGQYNECEGTTFNNICVQMTLIFTFN